MAVVAIPALIFLLHRAYLIHIDGQSNENVEKVSKCQASNENIRPIPHALVLVNDPEECGVPNDPYYEDGAGHNGVDILEDVPDICRLRTDGQQRWLRTAALGKTF